MAIPVLTKEEIWSEKDLNTLYNERRIVANELDDLVELWTEEAQGYIKLKILESYHAYISEQAWRVCIKMYCQWQSHDQSYSTDQQELSNGFYVKLEQTIQSLKENVTAQANMSVTPNKIQNFRVINPE